MVQFLLSQEDNNWGPRMGPPPIKGSFPSGPVCLQSVILTSSAQIAQKSFLKPEGKALKGQSFISQQLPCLHHYHSRLTASSPERNFPKPTNAQDHKTRGELRTKKKEVRWHYRLGKEVGHARHPPLLCLDRVALPLQALVTSPVKWGVTRLHKMATVQTSEQKKSPSWVTPDRICTHIPSVEEGSNALTLSIAALGTMKYYLICTWKSRYYLLFPVSPGFL